MPAVCSHPWSYNPGWWIGSLFSSNGMTPAPSPIPWKNDSVKDADKLWRFSPVGFWNEIERQGLADRTNCIDFFQTGTASWFFTQTAVKLAEEELRDRGKEIAAANQGF